MNKELTSEHLVLRPRDLSDLDLDPTLADGESDELKPSGLGESLGESLGEGLTEEQLTARLESVLTARIQAGDNLAVFQLAQLYYEQEDYQLAVTYFERAADRGDYQAMFQLGVIYYDGLTGQKQPDKGIAYMKKVADSESRHSRHLLRAAQYNVGLAYFQGVGVKQSDAEAERYWLLAADDGNPKASLKAQTTLGLFYAHSDFKDLNKSFFWHSEACGNGSLESQGALGVMYLTGLGCKKDHSSAFICLREAAERGNVYAMGHLASYYYRRKLYTKAVELAARVSQFTDPDSIAVETDCLPSYVSKGIAIATFYYGRCLHNGLGVKRDEGQAKTFYSKCFQFDADICASLQSMTQKGEI